VAQHKDRFGVTLILDEIPRIYKETTFDGQPLDLYVGWCYVGLLPGEFIRLVSYIEEDGYRLTDNALKYLEDFCVELDNKRLAQEI
jgi:hypothetical protein